MTILFAADACELPTYSLMAAVRTQSVTRAPLTAKPPTATPGETIRRDRAQRMTKFLGMAQAEAASEGLAPNPWAIENFARVLDLLPADLPAVEPYISEVGSVCLDWDENPQCQLSVLLKERGQIAFAAYIAGESVYGSTQFSASRLPESLLETAKRWSRASHAAA